MAEPLLKRTFSRLRGKDRSRRKTDPKLNEAAGKTDLVHGSSSSPSPSASAGGTEADQSVEADFTRHTQITVSKKQSWAKLSSTGSRDQAGPDQLSSLSPVVMDRDGCSGKAQASKQAWSQRTFREDGLLERGKDLDRDLGYSRDRDDAGLPELTSVSADLSIPTNIAKLSGQGAYLQHLERSSRAWVLSTGKSHGPDEAYPACLTDWRHAGEGENNIWYNPIPEEEDARAFGVKERERYRDPWRRREMEGALEERRDVFQQTCPSDAQCVGGAPAGISTSVAPGVSSEYTGGAINGSSGSSGSPGALKKSSGGSVGGGSSVMDKIKSPGTVRRLSMKMRKLPELRRKLSLRSSRNQRHAAHGHGASGATGGADEASPPNARKESSNNVISRYHLDSSAPARPMRRSSRTRSTSKGGYLSDGDSPELLPKQGSGQGSAEGSQESQGSPPPPPNHGLQDSANIVDTGSFRLYSLADQPRCAQRVSGLLTVHLLGVEELVRSPRADTGKDVFCAIQVDGVTRARTALLTCRGACLPLNHTFNLELERARLLKLVVLTPAVTAANDGSSSAPGGQTRNRVCCLGAVAIPPLFKASRSQQLCVKLEPRGLLYVKLTLLEQWEAPSPCLSELPPPAVFGVELRRLVEKEGQQLRVPLIIQKCVAEIEKRGLKVVGLYRLCGSAAVKKELRDAFERDSAAVTLSEELYPDINVITGILKDYLRELPSALITKTLYEVVLEAMSLRPACRNDNDAQRSQSTVSLLHCLPEPERATLSFLLDHLSLVASFSDCNLMTCQNLAVCFGPVLLTPTQESWRAGLPGFSSGASGVPGATRSSRSTNHSVEIASAVDFKRHIEALHYLLQLWPLPTGRVIDQSSYSLEVSPVSVTPPPPSQNPMQRRAQRVPLRVELPLPQDVVVVSRRGRGRLESPPCNRYAGDWSVCGRDFLSNDDADYDEVAGSESDEDEEEEKKEEDVWVSSGGLYADDFALDFDAPFTCRLSLKDFDNLISDLERELAKQINICL
ncbi:rho GTPase-activating protein SYDE2 [Pygocentrus nattereri]|uniref:rho GTPase-activating protein SYDE2 n=1 Tax=Pygocentrus nattereri TaxID=42514 RepID=UPI0008146FA9|nr:rho GTPase-activating protein SYDE2 [Pygocentrus nattereri]